MIIENISNNTKYKVYKNRRMLNMKQIKIPSPINVQSKLYIKLHCDVKFTSAIDQYDVYVLMLHPSDL